MSRQDRKALLVDDEPEFLEWVHEYLESRSLAVEYATSLPDALGRISNAGAEKYRLVLVDMNIPAPGGIEPMRLSQLPLASRYPGLIVASTCRNMGYGAHTVIAYTVHDDDAADAELKKLHCRYVLKGRPEVLKRVLNSSLQSRPAGHSA